jgi:hypothetical protein
MGHNTQIKYYLYLLLYLFPSIHNVFALEPNWPITQYSYDSWQIEQGFTESTTNSINQTPGYCWRTYPF